MDTTGNTVQGATAVITHRVRAGQYAGYDALLREVAPLCKASPGHLDWQIIRPIPGLTTTYSIVLRFDTRQNLETWLTSAERGRFVEKARPLLAEDDDYVIQSGLEFWFTANDAPGKTPVRWKQFVATWSAIYPLVLCVPLLVLPFLRQLGLPPNRYLDTLCISGVLVSLMVYVVMPRYTRLIHRWLFK